MINPSPVNAMEPPHYLDLVERNRTVPRARQPFRLAPSTIFLLGAAVASGIWLLFLYLELN